jgi:hypothetical protein
VNPRIALVGKPPATDGFGVRVAQNLDVTTREKALQWLAAWPNPPQTKPTRNKSRN